MTAVPVELPDALHRVLAEAAGGLRAMLDLVPHGEPGPWDRLEEDGNR